MSCNFSVRPYRTGSDCTGFSLCHSPNHSNTLEPSASTKIKLVYSPLVLCDCQDIGYFMVQAEGGYGCSKIKCIGHSKGKSCIICNPLPPKHETTLRKLEHLVVGNRPRLILYCRLDKQRYSMHEVICCLQLCIASMLSL